MAEVRYYDPVPRRRNKFWPPDRVNRLLGLIEQCGPNLCRVIIAEDLGLRGAYAERMVRGKLRDLGYVSSPL